MNKQFFYCVDVWIEDAAGLYDWLQQFADDDTYLKQAVYVNLLDSVDSEETREALNAFSARYPDNVAVYAFPGKSYAECYNAVKQAEDFCEYVNYTTTAAKLKVSKLQSMQRKIPEENPFAVYSFRPMGKQAKGPQKGYYSFKGKIEKCSIYKFIHFSMYLPGYVMATAAIKEHFFNTEVPEDADILFIINTLIAAERYVLTKINLPSSEPFENDYYNYRRQYNLDWYTDTLQQVYLPLLQQYPESSFVKKMVVYQISIRFACNRNDRSKNLLQGADLDMFFDTLADVFSLIDDNYLVAYNLNEMKMLPKFMGLIFLRIKHRDDHLMPTIADDGTFEYTAVYNNAIIDKQKNLKASITCMDYIPQTRELVIDGKLNNVYVFDYQNIQCYCPMGDNKKYVQQTQIYSLEKYFGISAYKDYTFQIRFSSEELEKMNYRISFFFQYRDIPIRLPLEFPRMQSRLVNKFPHSYWMAGPYMVTYRSGKKAICFQKPGKRDILKQELLLYRDFIKKSSKKERPRAIKSIALRMAYWLTKPFFRKKQVWITFDQLFKGGDNGDYFFRYVSDHHANLVDMYYVANPDCADYKRLKQKYNKLLPFNTIKAKLVAMHATCVFATRVDVKQYCGFGPQLEYYHRGLLTYDVFCLQHGLTIQKIAQYQNRLFDDTKLYFCVSPNEITNLSHPVYGYEPEKLILTGAPRYDGLINDDRKQILIAPTWRRNVTAGTNRKGRTHEYSINFKDTEYYRIYNGLINNKELIDCARETGYRIIYLVHPILSPQINDFHGPEQVTILGGASGDVSYEQMMCQSSLMLTDHSGIQFDFASMRKPLVYYHPDTLPPQYDAGGMDYETQAFGPVCRNEKEVVKALCDAMRRNCLMEDMYRKRADAFFAFDDHDNCKRIFEAAAKYQGLELK